MLDPSSKKKNLIFVLVVASFSGAICLFDFWSVFTGEDVFFHWDFIRFEFAMREYFLRLLRSGNFTALYPLSSLGLSLFANPHYKIFYPTNLFVMLFSDIRLGLHYDHLLHYLILASGWSMAILAAGLKRPAAFFIPIAMCSSGIIWSGHYRVELASMAWTGWLAWSLLGMARPPSTLRWARLRAGSLAGLFAGWIFLGGNPELLLPALIAASVLILFQEQNEVPPKISTPSKKSQTGLKTRLNPMYLRAMKALPASLLVFALVIAPIVWTAIDVVPFTVRAYGFNLRSIFQMPQSTASLLEFLTSIPRVIFESPDLYLTAKHDIDRIWYIDSRIGWIPLISACWGIYLQRHRFSWIHAIVIIAFLVLALGPNIPQTEGLWVHVPAMRRFRFTGKFFRFAYLIMIPFMAIGFSSLIKRTSTRPHMIKSVAAATLITIMQLHIMRPMDDLASTKTVFSPGTFTDLVDSAKNNPTNPPRVLVCPVDENTAPGVATPWFDLKHRGVPMAKAMDAAEMPMIRALNCSWVKHDSILAAFGISHLIVPTAEGGRTLVALNGSNPATGHLIAKALIEPAPPIREVGPFENYHLSWSKGIEAIQSGTVLVDSGHVLGANGRPIVTNLDHVKNLVGSAQCQPPDCRATFQPIPLTLNLTNDRIQKEVNTTQDSILIVPWSVLAGWHAMVDGHPSEILRLNAAVMGIPLPPGLHHIELHFMPDGLVPLLWISIACQIALVLYVLSHARIFFAGPVLE